MKQPLIRCGNCEEHYRHDVNLLDGKVMSFPPKRKRGGCQHPLSAAQAYDENAAEWVDVQTKAEPR